MSVAKPSPPTFHLHQHSLPAESPTIPCYISDSGGELREVSEWSQNLEFTIGQLRGDGVGSWKFWESKGKVWVRNMEVQEPYRWHFEPPNWMKSPRE